MPSMPKQATSTERTALYRLYDADGNLLYVGITGDPAERWKRHAMFMRWWGSVARKRIEWVPSWDEALKAERRTIQRESPRYNGTHNYPLAPLPDDAWPRITLSRGKAQTLAGYICQEIDSGRWLPGMKIPSCETLAAATGISPATANLALRTLQAEGRLIYMRGLGIFVYDGIPIERPNRRRP